MKNKKNKKIIILSYIFLSFLLITHVVNATSLDNAKSIVDNHYLYSQEKNVENYISLFESSYLSDNYGSDYFDFFKEVLSYIEIENYKIEYQYYTESEESLSLFFNLKAETIVNGENVKMDNDLVALFSKNSGKLYLKFIILQETFVEQMNREVIYNSAIASFIEEGSDLKLEAESKGISLIDFEGLIDKDLRNENFSSVLKSLFFVLLFIIIIFSLTVAFKGKIKSKKIIKFIENIQKYIFETWEKIFPCLKKTAKKISDLTKRLFLFSKVQIFKLISISKSFISKQIANNKSKSKKQENN